MHGRLELGCKKKVRFSEIMAEKRQAIELFSARNSILLNWFN